jgi:DHA2 family integral membrane protein (MFS transporter)
VFGSLPPEAQQVTRDSVGAAQVVATRLGAAAPAYLNDVANAFLAGLAVACLVVAGVALLGAVVAWRFLPARAEGDGPVEAPEPAEDAHGDRELDLTAACR